MPLKEICGFGVVMWARKHGLLRASLPAAVLRGRWAQKAARAARGWGARPVAGAPGGCDWGKGGTGGAGGGGDGDADSHVNRPRWARRTCT